MMRKNGKKRRQRMSWEHSEDSGNSVDSGSVNESPGICGTPRWKVM